jgi:hypothetical protein
MHHTHVYTLCVCNLRRIHGADVAYSIRRGVGKMFFFCLCVYCTFPKTASCVKKKIHLMQIFYHSLSKGQKAERMVQCSSRCTQIVSDSHHAQWAKQNFHVLSPSKSNNIIVRHWSQVHLRKATNLDYCSANVTNWISCSQFCYIKNRPFSYFF